MIVDATMYNENLHGKITSAHTVEFTMDDYITHRGCIYREGKPYSDLPVRSFYFEDMNEGSLVIGDSMGTINNSVLYQNESTFFDSNNKKTQKENKRKAK